MNDLTLSLTLPEINQILDALGKRPYEEVFQLVSKIQQQAQGQIQNSPTNGQTESTAVPISTQS